MIPRFRGLSIDENSKCKMQYGYLIVDGEQHCITNKWELKWQRAKACYLSKSSKSYSARRPITKLWFYS